MPKIKMELDADGHSISILSRGDYNDYFSLTDIAKYKNPEFPADVIKNWLRVRTTIEFLGLWEELNNPDFKLVEFDQFRIAAGGNAFVLSPKKWITSTNAIGITSSSGRYGGTYAHKDIAMEFASWISPEFRLYIIREYQRLKEDENSRLSLDWNLNRSIAKINYRIHTGAIKANLISPQLAPHEIAATYANEADMLNMALFGKTAKDWKGENPDAKGNIRDYATLNELLVLSNLESLNAEFIAQGIPQTERLIRLRQSAARQLHELLSSRSMKHLPEILPPKK